MFESEEIDFGNGYGEISMTQIYKTFSTLPEFKPFYGTSIKGLLRALSVYTKMDTENFKDSIENSFASVEYWFININLEKFLESIEKSLILQFFQYVEDCFPQGYYKIDWFNTESENEFLSTFLRTILFQRGKIKKTSC